MNETLVETFTRYRALIQAILPAESATPLPPAGENRQVYGPLFSYKLLLDYAEKYEQYSAQEFGATGNELERGIDQLLEETDLLTPSAVAAWSALLLQAAGKLFIRDAWTDLAADTFGRIVRGQADDGRLRPVSSASNPESSWYDELATLHALASYAVQAEDRTAARAVAKAAEFVQREIEPDHATGQPWGLFAFIWNWSTRPLADQLLHSLEMRKGSLDSASLILLQDTLYCLDLFL